MKAIKVPRPFEIEITDIPEPQITYPEETSYEKSTIN